MRLLAPFLSPRQWFRKSLFARLIVLNMLGLLVLLGGFLAFHESRQVLTNAYRQNLEAQARLIAGALSQTARADNPFEFFEPSLLNRVLPNNGRAWQLGDAQRVMNQSRMLSSARLRLYGRNGDLVLDSANMDRSTRVIAKSLPPMQNDEAISPWLDGFWRSINSWLRPPAPLLSEINAANGNRLSEVASALRGRPASLQRQSTEGGDILTVAVPVQGYRAIIGALMVSTQPGEIDALLFEERRLVVQLSAIALVVNVLTSLFLAATIIAPVRRLAVAIRGFGAHSPTLPDIDTIPDYASRPDEIGDLSGALRDMTNRLVARISTIDRFAADVAHELKNPLTSLHSAVQSLEHTDKATRPDDYAAMVAIIQNDVQRLNRRISDISNATRLDAELNRGSSTAFDLSELAETLAAALAPGILESHRVNVVARTDNACPVTAQKDRIAQIIDNLLTNAASFTPADGRVFVTTQLHDDYVLLIVADEGPGLAPDTQEKIFERFYTDRSKQPQNTATEGPASQAGHSGLGLSISRQIARAHGGDLIADNRPDGTGAFFTLRLPLSVPDPRGSARA
jgi:two-component system sensor histidine kinase ChvG